MDCSVLGGVEMTHEGESDNERIGREADRRGAQLEKQTPNFVQAGWMTKRRTESGELRPRPRLPLPEPISFADTNSGEMPPFPVHVFAVID